MLPHAALRNTFALNSPKLVDAKGRLMLLSVAAEIILDDHGQIDVPPHMGKAAYTRFSIRMQPGFNRASRLKHPGLAQTWAGPSCPP
ncbi:hypothetical protein [Dactylosporangium sp. CA-139066]|uniref:hypothetical protein n=1 Tax=Dactylosporangium sp. CA-139066 TaxID=3239930 RepID=UPI003D8AE0D4